MTQQVTFLEPAEVQAKLNDGTAYVIDVREPDEYAVAHIAGGPPSCRYRSSTPARFHRRKIKF